MIRILSPSSVVAASRLLRDSGFSVLGISTTALARSVCEDAIAGKGPVVLVAECEGEVRGIVTAIIDAPRYWKKFVMRHPIFACRVIARHMRRTKKSTGGSSAVDEEGDPAAFSVRWSESSPRVARVSLIAVSNCSRGRGLGIRLYETMFDYLRHKGVETVLAQIDSSNDASLRLHRRTGWTLGRQGARWQALRKLS